MPSIKPVTALAFVKCGQRLLLLAGEGSLLRVFDYRTSRFLQSLEVLFTESIHGIESCYDGNRVNDYTVPGRSSCLVWGGRSVCMVQLESQSDRHGNCTVQCQILTDRIQLVDWILNMCYWPRLSASTGSDSLDFALLTAHNVLFLLSIPVLSTSDGHLPFTAVPFSAGPLSVLYSGHLISLDSDRLLVASGTVFGEILVWTCTRGSGEPDQSDMRPGHLFHCFTGHEGSIFGVRISEVVIDDRVGHHLRVVASCSDDRTIRLWDISDIEAEIIRFQDRQSLSASVETGFGGHALDDRIHHNHCLATAMGHSSRIWGLRSLPGSGQSWQLLSYGEDATTYIWQLSFREPLRPTLSGNLWTVRFGTTQRYHTGKNIWAVATYEEPEGSAIATGGADGRIVSYSISSGKPQALSGVHVRLPSKEELVIHSEAKGAGIIRIEKTSSLKQQNTLAQSVFQSLNGSWKLSRILKSAVPTYPSGLFQGTASLTARSTTDDAYDSEYLYMEEGTLVTEQGFSLQGSRRYVYRYQQSTDTITAWFVKPDIEASVDYLFHDVEFEGNGNETPKQEDEEQSMESRATGHHLCVEDQYDARYGFYFKGSVLNKWFVGYDVTGPKKDYTANAEYTRSQVEQNTNKAIRSVENTKSPILCENTRLEEVRVCYAQDSLKNYSWISNHEVLVTTVKGRILLGQLQKPPTSTLKESQRNTVSWTEVTQLTDLSSYSLVASVPSLEAGLLSGTQGIIYFYHNARRSVDALMKLPRKVSSLFSQGLYGPSRQSIANGASKSAGVVAACLGSQIAYAFTICINDLSKEHATSELTHLELPQNLVVTSAHWIDARNLLILGSRDGAVCFYDLSTAAIRDRTVTACACYSHIHGDDAVTVIQASPTQDLTSSLSILTAGRNAKFAVHHIRLQRDHPVTHIQLETVHISEPSFGPNIEGALFDALTDDLILWGFRSKHFVVWNDTQQKETMAVECGGSHRSWAYQHNNHGSDGGRFIWTKASTYNIHVQAEASHHVIQPGSHGREIKAMALFSAERTSQAHKPILFATGAEDTTIRIYKYNINASALPHRFECQAIIKDHTTGIQQLKWCPDGRFLFSAGGCEELYAWRVQSVVCVGLGVVCRAKCPLVTGDSDLRVMDFDVSVVNDEISKSPLLLSVVYSDSSVRVSYHTSRKRQG